MTTPAETPATPVTAVEPLTATHTGRTNPLAIASFALSLSGLTIFAQIAGIITGHLALKQIKETNEEGNGLAKAGLIISYVMVGVSVLAFLFFIAIWGLMVAGMAAWFGNMDPSVWNEPNMPYYFD